jgi:hypothetical protein
MTQRDTGASCVAGLASAVWRADTSADDDHDACPLEARAQGGHLDVGGTRACRRPERREDPDQEDRDLRHRHPHLQLGRVGPEDHPRPDARRPRVRGRDRRHRQSRERLLDRRPRERRGPHHLRPLPQLPRGQASPLPQHRGRRRERAPARSPSTWSFPRSTRSSSPTRSPTTSRRSSIPLGNAAHTALSFDMVGEDVLITGAGPIGCMAVAIAATSARATSSSPT